MLEYNKIYLGDCLDIMNSIDDESTDMILCDLPYGITQNEWDSVIPIKNLWEQYKRIIKNNGVIILTASGLFTAKLMLSNEKMYRYKWVWEKSKSSGFMNAKKMPLKSHEDILVFYKNLPTYNPQGVIPVKIKTGRSRKGNDRNYGKTGVGNPDYIQTTGNYPKDILKINNPSNKGHQHPTQKPVALFEYLIKTYTNEGDLVLDNCIGSGTTAIAAINTNRNWIGIEMNEEYYSLANKRIETHKINTSII
jgi:site-specific DNA-methyltransferase (adenine-specific)